VIHQQLEESLPSKPPAKPNVNKLNLDPTDYLTVMKQQANKFNELQQENERLKHFLPDSYTEMRLREKQL